MKKEWSTKLSVRVLVPVTLLALLALILVYAA